MANMAVTKKVAEEEEVDFRREEAHNSQPERSRRLKNVKILAVFALALFMVALPTVVAAQGHASAQEVVDKVREAASTLSKTGDVAQFNQKPSQWVWKDTYIFVLDCDKMANAAHPMRPDLRSAAMDSIKDSKGNSIFPNPKAICEAARKPSGTWVEYWWAKPREKEGSRKVSYLLGAKGTPYVAAAGIHDEKATIAELSKLTAGK
jgi:cytochrome c